MSLWLLGVDQHPADAVFVGDHAEGMGEERRPQRHLDLAALAQRGVEPLRLRIARALDGQRESLETRLAVAKAVRGGPLLTVTAPKFSGPAGDSVTAGAGAAMPTTCNAALAGVPANDGVVPGPTWQVLQLFVMPLWLISEPLNLAPLGTGRVGTLEPVPTWQTSQEAVVGMWFEGRPTMLKLMAGIANEGAAGPWHCTQLLVVLGAFRWMSASVGSTA